MARYLSWALAALLLVAAPVRAVALCSHPDEATSRQNPGGKGRPDQDKRQPPPKWTVHCRSE